ncbi:restriction endonuclease [Sphingomonas ginsenosidimutans]|jgi:restriction system protein|uniref:Restriction endonuclease n=1 Tax=Sphingomonas ginsenosidimutans TaxID=862134 RepID=A0A2A4HS49_9SPHN|nr:restriction endonuclease [Sphingomonas ginsenosidimutans]PCG07732.1 restriction endonuclease [Sphingomonas ginsenosidimutans]
MAIPDYQALMLPVLRLAATGVTRVPDAAAAIADQLGLTEAEREEMLPSRRQRVLHNRIHWAKFYMAKAGLIDSPARGRFTASADGKALLATQPAAITVETLKTYPAFAQFYAVDAQASPAEASVAEAAATATATPEEQIDAAHGVLHAALKTELLQRVLAQSPAFFERAIVDLLVAMGYGGSHEGAALSLGRSGDGGVDGVIDEDRLGLDRIYVQAKRYAPHVGVGRPDVQGFVGSLVGFGATKGVFVTTSSFSAPAIDFVRHLPQRVVLIDGTRLAELMIEHGVGVRVSRTIAVKRLDEDFFADE